VHVAYEWAGLFARAHTRKHTCSTQTNTSTHPHAHTHTTKQTIHTSRFSAAIGSPALRAHRGWKAATHCRPPAHWMGAPYGWRQREHSSPSRALLTCVCVRVCVCVRAKVCAFLCTWRVPWHTATQRLVRPGSKANHRRTHKLVDEQNAAAAGHLQIPRPQWAQGPSCRRTPPPAPMMRTPAGGVGGYVCGCECICEAEVSVGGAGVRARVWACNA